MIPKKIVSIIQETSELFKESSRDIQIKCPYCGGSIAYRRKPTLYISKYPVSGTYVFHCFRAVCGVKGTLYQFLQDQGLFKYLEAQEILEIMSPSDKTQVRRRTRKTPNELTRVVREEQVLDPVKEQYIKDRIHLNGELPEFIKKTVITNLDPLIPHCIYEISDKFKYHLKSFVGFRSLHRKFVVCRNPNKSQLRYFMLRLDNGTDFYCTSPQLNNLKITKNGILILAEGIFTLLSGYYRLLEHNFIEEDTQVVLCATNGGKVITYKTAYEFCVYNFGIPDWEVFLLSDYDIRPEHYTSLLPVKTTIFYNKCGGDFADLPFEIELYKIHK